MPTIALDSQSAPSPRTSSASPSNFVYPPSLGAVPTSAAAVMSVVSQSISQPCHSAYNHTPTTTCRPVGFLPTPLEQYRLQLYNYAVHMDRLRCPQYNSGQQLLPTATTASAVAAFGYSNVAAAAAAAAAASVRGVGGSSPYAPSSRLALSMSLFPQRIFQPEEPKPQHSYIGLIAMAILSSAETKLVLSDIYQYILDNYPYFRTRGPGWRNSIRHNLSLNDCFVKSGRSANGKGHYWAIHAANIDDFRKGDFRRRKAQRKVRKHMGLSVDDEGTDSPSPPPYAVTPPPTHHSHQNLTSTHAYFSYLHHQQQQHNPHNAQQFHAPYNHDQNCEQSLVAAAAAAAVASDTEATTAAHYINPVDVALPTAQKAYNNQLSIIKETTTTTASVIANLYSQTRKRQFDVASLLAPDVELNAVDDDTEAIERAATTTTTTTKRTLITKLSVQQHHHHPHHQRQLVQFTAQQQLQHNLSELDEQDIDVVTSDVEEDVEGECEEIDETIEEESELKEENNNCKNNCRTSVRRGPTPYSVTDQEQPDKHQQSQAPHKYVNTAETIAEPTKHFEYRNSNTIDRNIHQKSTAQQQQQHFHRIIHQLPHELNNVDPCIFGRYYGTYMAAAAAQQVVARHIRSSISFPLPMTGTSPTLLMEPGIATQQVQSQQSQQQSHNQTKPSQQQKPLQQQ